VLRRRLVAWPVALFAGVLNTKIALGQPRDIAKFRSEVLEILRRRFPETPAVAGDNDGSIRLETVTVNLHNIYAAVQQLPVDRKEAAIIEFLQRAVEASNRARTASTPSWPEVRKVIYPRLLSVDYLKAGMMILHRQFAADVILGYVIDYGQTVGFVDTKAFESWGIANDLLHDTAIANLEALSLKVAIEPMRPPDGAGRFVAIATRDTYDATRLVLPGFRARLMAALGETFFVGIPNRDFLVAWSSDFSRFANIVAQIEKDARQQPYPLTDAVFVVSRDAVRPATAVELRGR
jgi:uncharacterized protein YtpQ (UPF0354 family)